MSSCPDTAAPTRLAVVEERLVGQKVRLAGKLLSYDPVTGLGILLDHDAAVLVDVSLCVDHWSGAWVRERLGGIMVIGHLEKSDEELPIPTIPSFAPTPALDPHLFLRAILVIKAGDLDLEIWNLSIEMLTDS
ncbi:uncharacterized protein BT62DRAFT_104840 [Guyanagaster necrorhizus]|uniref:Uncharacterized protein n=1 Tax=Guyanagaster necrorhizus TaxID=856835 RepID=A0A9P7VSR2_9AGAR|nr:uncharacterized protein BT62DRAFT_104840 [Guyanagaster necrorhizus MCA 3950]KAG7446229.1 hypothetical protein BT62DRAFT_104840 [Guyanagaster necrorhizus MCA 3950]